MASFTAIGVEAQVKGFSGFMRDLGKMDKGISGLGKSAGSVSKGGIATLGKGIATVGLAAGAAAIGGIAALGAGLVALGVASVREGAIYTKEMSNVKALTNATAIEFDKLSASAEMLGSTTKFTAMEAAEGMSFLAMAGFEVNDIIGAMPGVLDLAAAGNIALGASADVVSNVLSGFNKDVSETNKVVDIMAATATSSNTNILGIGEAMKSVAPVAASLELDIGDIAAAIGVLGDNAIQGGEAGTALKAGLLRLAAPTDKANKLIRELGLEVFDTNGKMLPLPQIMGRIGKATEDMGDKQKIATLQTIFGTEHIAKWQVLLAKGEEGLKSYGDELRDSAGTAARIAAEQLNNLSGDVTLLSSAFSGVKIKIFKALEPLLRKIVQVGTSLVKTLGPILVKVFDKLVAAASPVFDVLEDVLGAFERFGVRGGAISILGLLGFEPEAISEILGFVDQIIETVTTSFAKVTGAFEKFGVRGGAISILGLLGFEPETISEILGFIDQIIETVTTSFAKVTGAFERFGVRGGAISILGVLGLEPETIAFLMSTFDTIAAAVMSFIESINIDVIVGAIKGIATVLAGIGIVALITTIASVLGTILSPIGLIIAAAVALGIAWETNFLGIRDTVLAVWENSIKPAFFKFAEWLQTNIPIAMQKLGDFWETTLKPKLLNIRTFITEKVIPAIEKFGEWLQTNIPIAMKKVGDFWETTLKPALLNIKTFITEKVIPAVLKFAGIFREKLLSAIKTVSDFFKDKLIPRFDKLKEIYTEHFSELLPILQETFQELVDVWKSEVQPALDSLWEALGDLGEQLGFTTEDTGDLSEGSLILDGILLALDLVIVAVKGSLALFRGAVELLIPLLEPLGKALGIIIGIFTDKVQKVKDFAKAFIKIKDAIGDVIEKIGDLITKLAEIVFPDFPDLPFSRSSSSRRSRSSTGGNEVSGIQALGMSLAGINGGTNSSVTNNNINISIANSGGDFASDAQMAQSVRISMARALT